MDQRTQEFVAARDDLWSRPGPSGSGLRREYAELVDAWLRDLLILAGGGDKPVALVGVGGTGRSELAPGSDLDLLLLHDESSSERVELGELADRIWYPIWDAGLRLDHSVRTVNQALRMARDDLRVAVGLLDARHIAGRMGATSQLREQALAGWRASAPHRIGELRTDAEQRTVRAGELAYLLEPDLKESYGGLRETVALRALAASWLIDVPRSGVAEATSILLDVRDALHRETGRTADRLLLHDQAAIADRAGYRSGDDLLRAVSGAGRTIAYATEVAWYRADRVTARPSRRGILRRRGAVDPQPVALADGVIEQDGEVILARDADPANDPGLGLRAAAAAAQAGLRLSPSSLERIRAAAIAVPDPWTPQMRDSFVALLGAGQAAVDVWEALDQVGLWDRWLPGWGRLRALPQRNPVHRYTVDRHLVEAAVQAAALTRSVARPDLLLVGALLHDVGKGLPGDHSTVGVPVVEAWARRMGFPEADIVTLAALCRYHLLFPDTATRRDPDDPQTIAVVLDALGNPHGPAALADGEGAERSGGLRGTEGLALLAALTEADARATGPLAWTAWRAALVTDLVARTHAALEAQSIAAAMPPSEPHPLSDTDGLVVTLARDGDEWVVHVASDDQAGLLATVAGVLSANRLAVRSAAAQTSGERALQTWRVHPERGDVPAQQVVRDDLRAALDGRLDLGARLQAREASYQRPRIAVPDPRVDVLPSASADSTVVEVRAHDGPALLYRVGMAIARADVSVRSARVATMGAEAVDAFYLCDGAGGPLSSGQSARVVGAILDELSTSSE